MFQAYQHYFNQKNRENPGNIQITSSSVSNLNKNNVRRGYRPITANMRDSNHHRSSTK